MKAWLVFLVACAGNAKPQAPEAQSHCRTTAMHSCSGDPDSASNYEVSVCDECTDDTQCTAQAGGECHDVGDNMCNGPLHRICKYPEARCGNRICAEPVVEPPP